MISRARSAVLIFGLSVAVLTGSLSAQPGPEAPSAVVEQLRDSVYSVKVGFSQAGFVIGDKGVIVIDTTVSTDTAAVLLAQIATVTDKPVDTVIITHSDPDHVGGLPAFSGEVDVIAHENVRSALTASVADYENGGPIYGPIMKNLDGHLPNHPISDSRSLTVDGVRLEILYVGPAHSNSDLAVYLPDQKVIFAADLLLNQLDYPIIHLGGTSAGWIRSMKAILALDADIYVPGHGGILPKAELAQRLQDVVDRRAAIKSMVMAGHSLQEVQDRLPEAEDPSGMSFPNFNETTYRELTVGYPPAVPPWANMSN